MKRYTVCFMFMLVSLEQISWVKSFSRQKRCIVIQKQSGSHGDSSEGDDRRNDEPRDRTPLASHHHHNRRHGGRYDLQDAEDISPELLKYKIGSSKKLNELYRLGNKLKRITGFY